MLNNKQRKQNKQFIQCKYCKWRIPIYKKNKHGKSYDGEDHLLKHILVVHPNKKRR